MIDIHNEQSEVKEVAKVILEGNGSEPNKELDYESQIDRHEQVQHWTDTLYSLAKKVIVVILGIVFLIDIVRPREDGTIEIITELYRLSLEQGRMEFLAPAVAIFFLARNLPIFVKGMRKMFKDS